jgi:galactonate dehydratase
MTGLLASERLVRGAQAPTPASGARVDPRSAIKITRIEIIPVNTLRTIFVKMHTDVGVVGIGEGTVEGRIGTVVAAIKELEPYLIGKDPRQPAHHWQAIYRQAFYRGDIVLTSALSAVDIAMWDIKARRSACPSMSCSADRRATASASTDRRRTPKRRAGSWPRATPR